MYTHIYKYIYIYYNYNSTSIVVCTDLQGKESHRQVGVGIVVTSSVMVSPLSQNARDLGSIPALGAIFPIFLTI